MQRASFNTAVSILTLFFFLATPISVFAQGLSPAQVQQLIQLQALQQAGTISPQDAQTLQTLTLLQQQNFQGVGQQGPGFSGASNILGQLGFLSLLGGQGGLGGNNPASTLALAGLMGGGGFGGGFGGGGPLGIVSQSLTLAGALSGNMGLIIGGMITSMIGGFVGGGFGGTPQQGTPDEQYVAQGQAGPYGSGSYNPYYPTPSPASGSGSGQSSSSQCKESIFIVKDTTATPNVTKPYPNTKTINQSECVLAINSDSASHTIQAKRQGSDSVITEQAIDKEKSHAFRFPDKNTYTLCVDGNASACTTVTVQ